MTDNSAFGKKTIETVGQVPRESILEELNLPPQLISFLRQNKRALQIGGICLVVGILGWTFFDGYMEKQRDQAAAQLATALLIADDDGKAAALRRVIDEYPKSDAGRWSRFELAHLDFSAGRLAEALAGYSGVSAELDQINPMRPLVELSLAQTHEGLGNIDQAIASYQRLSEMVGFGDQGFAGLGRMYEKNKEWAKAQAAYEEYLSYNEQRSATQTEIIQNKLLLVKAAREASQ